MMSFPKELIDFKSLCLEAVMLDSREDLGHPQLRERKVENGAELRLCHGDMKVLAPRP
jgi:hypothetical protein